MFKQRRPLDFQRRIAIYIAGVFVHALVSQLHATSVDPNDDPVRTEKTWEVQRLEGADSEFSISLPMAFQKSEIAADAQKRMNEKHMPDIALYSASSRWISAELFCFRPENSEDFDVQNRNVGEQLKHLESLEKAKENVATIMTMRRRFKFGKFPAGVVVSYINSTQNRATASYHFCAFRGATDAAHPARMYVLSLAAYEPKYMIQALDSIRFGSASSSDEPSLLFKKQGFWENYDIPGGDCSALLPTPPLITIHHPPHGIAELTGAFSKTAEQSEVRIIHRKFDEGIAFTPKAIAEAATQEILQETNGTDAKVINGNETPVGKDPAIIAIIEYTRGLTPEQRLVVRTIVHGTSSWTLAIQSQGNDRATQEEIIKLIQGFKPREKAMRLNPADYDADATDPKIPKVELPATRDPQPGH